MSQTNIVYGHVLPGWLAEEYCNDRGNFDDIDDVQEWGNFSAMSREAVA